VVERGEDPHDGLCRGTGDDRHRGKGGAHPGGEIRDALGVKVEDPDVELDLAHPFPPSNKLELGAGFCLMPLPELPGTMH
jgi:hypothetical protein